MELWEIELKLESAYMTPWHADVMFGHLAWAYREQYGEEELKRWLHDFREGTPPFIISDGYVKHGFPRPFLPPPKKRAESKQAIIQQIKQGKKMKQRSLIHEDDFKRFLAGKDMTFSREIEGSIESSIDVHNVINRATGSSLDSDGLYELESFHLKNTDRLSVFIRVRDKEALEDVEHLFQTVSLTGYGKKKNIGFGQFQVDNVVPRHDLDNMKEEADAVVWLNHAVPKADDPVKGWYKLDTKYGKVAGTIHGNESPFKRPLTRILPGAVFKTRCTNSYYGKMVTHIYPYHSSVMQYGYALALPVRLPEYLRDNAAVS